MSQTYKTLTVGDVRQLGDEVRRTVPPGGYNTGGDRYSDGKEWLPVRLVGHPILSIDTVASEFRRPL